MIISQIEEVPKVGIDFCLSGGFALESLCR